MFARVRPGAFSRRRRTPHAVWARVQAPRLQHGPGTRRASRNTEEQAAEAGDVRAGPLLQKKKCKSVGPEISYSFELVRRAGRCRTESMARARAARAGSGPRRSPARVLPPRARCISRRGRAFYAPAGGMRHGQWRRTTGLRATGGGPRAAAAAGGGRDRPQPANAPRTAQAPRASGDVDVERGARGERSRRVRGSRERFRPSGSALQSPPATPQITLSGPRSGPAARHRSAAVTRDTTLRSSPNTASRAFHTKWQGDERRQLNMILCL